MRPGPQVAAFCRRPQGQKGERGGGGSRGRALRQRGTGSLYMASGLGSSHPTHAGLRTRVRAAGARGLVRGGARIPLLRQSSRTRAGLRAGGALRRVRVLPEGAEAGEGGAHPPSANKAPQWTGTAQVQPGPSVIPDRAFGNPSQGPTPNAAQGNQKTSPRGNPATPHLHLGPHDRRSRGAGCQVTSLLQHALQGFAGAAAAAGAAGLGEV